MQNTWRLVNKAKKAIVLALSLPPTVHLVTKKVQNVSFTFTEMTVIDYIKTIFISTGTRIWHSYLFGILYHVDVDACFDVTSKM